MASSSAVQGNKAGFFHIPLPKKQNKADKPTQITTDAFEPAADAPKLNKLPKAKPQPLRQGDETARKNNGLLDCFGLLGVLALCCICCEGSGNAGYGGRRWNNKNKGINKPASNLNQPPAANTPQNTGKPQAA